MSAGEDEARIISGSDERVQALSKSEKTGLLYAAVGTVFFATTPVFIRWASPLSSYEIAEGRLLIAFLMVYGLLFFRGGNFNLYKEELPKFALFGLITALHFLFYIASLNFTTIAHSLAIVYTAPIFVTLFSAIFLKEPIPTRKWSGVIITVIGISIMVGFQPNFDRRMLIGDVLALGSAIMFGFYSIMGRSQREQYSLFMYAGTVYGFGALWLSPVAWIHRTPEGYTLIPLISVLMLGIFPLGFGHTLYNAALRRTHATYVNLIATQEVTGGILLGILLLHEIPSINSVIGVIVSLAGIALVLI